MKDDIFTFSCKSNDGENVTLTVQVQHEYNIYTFHRLCKRFAAACGYLDKSIEDVFGESQYEEW